MALSAMLERGGHVAKRVHTVAKVSLEKVGEGFKITKIALQTEAQVAGIDEAAFKETAEKAKTGCPVSQALSATPIELDAKLLK
ncbi:MAG TPA: OsmC family peroxiredoxin, partial [Tepidisphaeraceae bacterium]|nr:OsmC family peroxiredoxin [Tepidisphaeraceae bacterium]